MVTSDCKVVQRKLSNDYDCKTTENDDEEDVIVYELDQNTINAIIKLQALVRGFLTRKLIFEHL